MISDARLEKALQFLAQTDEECAQLKTDVARTEYMAKLLESLEFKGAEGKSVEDRKAVAKASADVQKRWDTHFERMGQYETLRAKRATEELVVEVWRSLNANRRQGQM